MGEWVCKGGNHFCAKWLPVVALGQVLSLLVAGTAATSALLVANGLAIPVSQSLCVYILLAVVNGSFYWFKGGFVDIRWKAYLLLAFVDLQANYSIIKAYQYTSITSVLLLDCWTIPCVVVGTWLFLGVQYTARQFLGIFICTLGIVVLVFSDVHANDTQRGSRALLGDLLVLISATLYACSNVGEEYLLKKNSSRVEVLTFLGVFGSIFSCIQLLLLERQEIASVHWELSYVLYFLGFAFMAVLCYILTPTMFQIGGSTLFNLSLLTSDIWGIAIRSLLFRQHVDTLYFVAFGAFAAGLIIYSVNLQNDGTDVSKYHALHPQSASDPPAGLPPLNVEEGSFARALSTHDDFISTTVTGMTEGSLLLPEEPRAEQHEHQPPTHQREEAAASG